MLLSTCLSSWNQLLVFLSIYTATFLNIKQPSGHASNNNFAMLPGALTASVYQYITVSAVPTWQFCVVLNTNFSVMVWLPSLLYATWSSSTEFRSVCWKQNPWTVAFVAVCSSSTSTSFILTVNTRKWVDTYSADKLEQLNYNFTT